MSTARSPRRRLRAAFAAVALLALAAALVVAAIVRGGAGGSHEPAPRPGRPALPPVSAIAPHSVFHRAVAPDAPLDPSSGPLVAHLQGFLAADRAASRGPWIDTHKCAPPIYRAPAGQRRVHVTLDNDTPSNRPLQRAFDRVPIPDGAQPSPCSDASMAVWQPSTDSYWEFWRLKRASDGWHATWGGASDRISKSPGYFGPADWPGAKSYWGTSATSLIMPGGVITLDDLRRGSIDHALGLVLPETRDRQWSWPAQRTDGSRGDTAPDSIPAGAHFRLDPALDVDALDVPPLTKMIARAAQKYGFYVTDRTHYMVGVGVESAVPYVGADGPDPYARYLDGKAPNDILNAFPWDKLQLLKLQLSPG